MLWKGISYSEEYYMTGGCGIFALALNKLSPGGDIYVFTNEDEDADPWSEDIPYEVTHVFYENNGKFYDLTGETSLKKMSKIFGVNSHGLYGPYSASLFEKKYMGESDRYPLYAGNETEIKEAIETIKSNSHLYPFFNPYLEDLDSQNDVSGPKV